MPKHQGDGSGWIQVAALAFAIFIVVAMLLCNDKSLKICNGKVSLVSRGQECSIGHER